MAKSLPTTLQLLRFTSSSFVKIITIFIGILIKRIMILIKIIVINEVTGLFIKIVIMIMTIL